MSVIHWGERLARTSLQLLQSYDRRWVATSGGRVHLLERRGSGPLPPVVLLHGLSSAGVHYLRVVPHLRAVSRLVLPDLPGHGFSAMPAQLTGATLLAGMFESLDAIIDRPTILAGTSLGGYVAIRYALARPEKIAGLMVAAPAGAFMSQEELLALRGRFELKTHGDALRFVDALFAQPHPFRHFVAVGLRKYFTLPQTLAVLEEMRVARLFTPEELRSLTMPVLFLWGDSERLFSTANLEWFKAHLPPHARVVHPRGWGHSGFLDDPKGFALWVLRFACELGGLSTSEAERMAAWR